MTSEHISHLFANISLTVFEQVIVYWVENKVNNGKLEKGVKYIRNKS